MDDPLSLARRMIALLPQDVNLDEAESIFDLAKTLLRAHSFAIGAGKEGVNESLRRSSEELKLMSRFLDRLPAIAAALAKNPDPSAAA